MQKPATAAMKLTPDEFLEMELASPIKHEYVAGEIFAMTGASDIHNIIVGNVYMALRNHLKGSPCRVFMTDMKLRLDQADAYYYPDLMVTCEKPSSSYFREQPVLVVEVLSSSTAKFDAIDKRRDYQTLESLQEYLLISQECMDARVFRREESGWNMHIYTDGMSIPLHSVGLDLPIGLVYEEAWD